MPGRLNCGREARRRARGIGSARCRRRRSDCRTHDLRKWMAGLDNSGSRAHGYLHCAVGSCKRPSAVSHSCKHNLQMKELCADDVPKVIQGNKRSIRIGSELPKNAFIRLERRLRRWNLPRGLGLGSVQLSALLHQGPLRKPLIGLRLGPAIFLHGFGFGPLLD